MKNIPISEIFESIQWEWRNTWKPSIFIRFWWCNFACTWCDSKYSWDNKVEEANLKSLEEIIKIVISFKSKHIIFTWWEPSLFQKQIKEIQEELGNNYTYELETNWSNKLINEIHFNQINISPKLLSSWNKKYNLKILESNFWWAIIDFKFVCLNKKSCNETDLFLKELKKNELDLINNIYIMPLWINVKSQNNKTVLNYCMNNWYNYCLRQHLILFWDWKWK